MEARRQVGQKYSNLYKKEFFDYEDDDEDLYPYLDCYRRNYGQQNPNYYKEY